MKKACSFILITFSCITAKTQVTCQAISSSGSAYQVFTDAGFGVETPDCVHLSFGHHLTQVFDAELQRNVFIFHSHINDDNDRCINFDRVRMEVKGGPNTSAELQHPENSTSYSRWKFRLDEDFIGATSFCHIFQNKAKGGEDSGYPILTLTARVNTLELMHNGGDTGTDLDVVAEADLTLFKGRWVEVYVRQLHAESGELELSIKDMTTGDILLSYNNTNIDLWREGADYNRPKWGMYRFKREELQDEQIQFADFCISETGTDFCPADSVLIPNITALKEVSKEREVHVYPNPTSLKIQISLGINIKGNATIFSLDGQKIQSDIFIHQTEEVDVSNLPSGIYVIAIRLENGNTLNNRFIRL